MPLRVVRQTWLAEGVLELRLADPDGGRLPGWTPGAHLSLTLAPGLTRDYSLCGDGADWTVAVLREPDSRGGGAYVHERLRVGDLVTAEGPRNNFPLRPAASHLLIAGGIGITPLLAMSRQLACTEGTDWQLFYCGRRRAGMAYLPELREIAGDRLTVHCDDERGGPPELDSLLASATGDTLVYCCGPEPLIAAVGARVPGPERLHVERFRAAPAAPPATARTFDVVCAGSGARVSVPPGRSVLEALASAGITVPSSCREGICGTCETKVLGGEPEHLDQLLTEQERADGQTMLPCVSRAHSAELLLDLP